MTELLNLEEQQKLEQPEIEEDQKLVNEAFSGIFGSLEQTTKEDKSIKREIPRKSETRRSETRKNKSKVIYAEGLTCPELVEKYISSISVREDIHEIAKRIFDAEIKTPKSKSRKSTFIKKLQIAFEDKAKEEPIIENEEEVIRLKPKPDISVHKSKLIGQIRINYGALGVTEPNDLEKKTEGELEKILVTSVKQMDNSYTALNLRDIGYFLLESGASISESVKPELFSGLKEKHVANKENLKQIIGACMNEYESVIKKYASPINILALKLGTIYAETALSNIHKSKV